jgi:hypothetical protein
MILTPATDRTLASASDYASRAVVTAPALDWKRARGGEHESTCGRYVILALPGSRRSDSLWYAFHSTGLRGDDDRLILNPCEDSIADSQYLFECKLLVERRAASDESIARAARDREDAPTCRHQLPEDRLANGGARCEICSGGWASVRTSTIEAALALADAVVAEYAARQAVELAHGDGRDAVELAARVVARRAARRLTEKRRELYELLSATHSSDGEPR